MYPSCAFFIIWANLRSERSHKATSPCMLPVAINCSSSIAIKEMSTCPSLNNLESSNTCSKRDGSNSVILAHTINLLICLNIVQDRSTIQQANSNYIHNRWLSQAGDSRSQVCELIHHLVGSNVPDLHSALSAGHQNLVEVRWRVEHVGGGEFLSKLDFGVKIYRTG